MVSVQVLGSLVTNVGSGVSYIVSSALETIALIASKYAQELIPISSHISGTDFVINSCVYIDECFLQRFFLMLFIFHNPGILDYLEGFNVENLHKVA